MAAQLNKAIFSASKHKSALDELNAALGKSIVRPWEKLYVDYYSGEADINIFQEDDDGTSLFLCFIVFHSYSLQNQLLPP